MSDSEAFLLALGGSFVNNKQPLILCAFDGDPNDTSPKSWRPIPWWPENPLPQQDQNGYVTISTFRKAADGTHRRQTQYFKRGLCFFVDDVGTKVDPKLVENLPPSASVETSPGNFQYYYFLSDADAKITFDTAIKSFIDQKLLGDDSGMNGVNRVGRIPGYLNMKPKHNNFRVQLRDARLDLRYTVKEVIRGLNIELRERRRPARLKKSYDKNTDFPEFLSMMRRLKMLKHERSNEGGWIECRCPWLDNHTDRADNGAAISFPSPENDYQGGFRCHHGHCNELGWSDLTDYLSRIAEDNIEATNEYYRGNRNRNKRVGHG